LTKSRRGNIGSCPNQKTGKKGEKGREQQDEKEKEKLDSTISGQETGGRATIHNVAGRI
jgi:hypothetical protein